MPHIVSLRPVLYVIGNLLVILAMAMLLPTIVHLSIGDSDWISFATSLAITLFCGVLMILMNLAPHLTLSLRQTFLLTTLSYLVMGAFSAIPFMISQVDLSVTDAFFESMSALTTTGSTVMTGLDTMPAGILLWRSILQWLGGIGIIAIGIVVLPFLGVGGMQLFKTESSDRSDKVIPRASDLARHIGMVYLVITLVCIIALNAAGMSFFEAVCHGLTSVSSGGFSTRDASIGSFASPAIEWILIVAMLSGALPFVRYISFARGDFRAFSRDSQVRHFLSLVFSIALLVGLWLALTGKTGWLDGMRTALFHVISIVTTTGYATTDYQLWGGAMMALFFVLTMLGGCTGSTAGGIKMFRFEILFLVFKTHLRKLFSPHQIIPLKYNQKPVDSDITLSVMNFMFVFFVLLLFFTVVLNALGLDFVTALSASVTAIANVGPGLGEQIGPAGNFVTLPEAAKWILTFAMLLGRLEFFTVLVLLNPAFWRR